MGSSEKKHLCENLSVLFSSFTLALILLFDESSSLGTCNAGELRCQSSGHCVPIAQVCDGIRDCDDGLDEHYMVCIASKLRRGICARGAPKKVGVFQCQYSGCIPMSRVCDGNVNCLDGSDESEHVCGANSCLPGQFRCKYGACIADWRMCNGVANCPDASDESSEVCKKIKCKEDQFQCKYGACIPQSRICDARRHCYDGSDESPELCFITKAKIALKWEAEDKKEQEMLAKNAPKQMASLVSPSSQEMQHQLLIPQASQITGIIKRTTSTAGPETPKTTVSPVEIITIVADTSGDSYTGNTENESSSEHVTAAPASSPLIPARVDLAGNNFNGSQVGSECALPPIPYNAEATITSCRANKDAYYCSSEVTAVPFGTIVQFDCSAGFIVDGEQLITCLQGGDWSAPPPQCEPYVDVRFGLGKLIPKTFTPHCPGLNPSRGVKIECLDPKNLEIKSCSEQHKAGVEARLTCSPYYRPSGDLPINYEKCGVDGRWTPGVYSQFSCVPDCGISENKKTPYITNGLGTERGQWPWHVGIYLLVNNKLQYICGGALITDQSVLTSAHCVVHRSGGVRNSSEVVLFLGKQQIGLPDGDPFVQRRQVTKIFVEDSFNYLTLDSDVAILALDTPAVLTFYVRPVCFPQTSNSFLEEYQLAPGNIGTVLGWGLTENGSLSAELRMSELPVVSTTECVDSHKDFFASMTRSTTFCAGYKNGTAVCNGDSGSGLYFRAVNRGNSRWYIQGLVSYGVPEEDTKKCSSNHYAVFTRVGRYGDWIVRTLSRENLI